MGSLICNGQPTFGFRYDSYPLKNAYTAEESRQLQQKLYEHKLLIFHLPLDYTTFDAFASQIGEAETAQPVGFSPEGHPCIRLQSNAGGTGMDYAGEYWHSDGPWNIPPSKATLLSCIEAPAVGGETLFIDMEYVYRELPDTLRSSINGKRGNYPCRQTYLDFMKKKNLPPREDKLKELADVTHPLVKAHPVTGRHSLFLNEEWLKSIDGLHKTESDPLLKEIYEFALQDRFIVTYRWEKDDLLIWDNNSLLHNGVRPDPRYPKVTKRITIKG